MTGVHVKIKPAIINWVFEHIPSDNVSPDIVDTLETWKEGSVQPTFNQVKTISHKLHIPLGYFFLNSPPKEELPLLEYRTIDSVAADPPSRNLVDTIGYAENVQDWMRNYLIDAGSDAQPFVGSAKGICSADLLADLMRKNMHLEIDWYTACTDPADSFNVIRKKLESIGILILMNGIVGTNSHRKLDINEFRAFTLIDDYAPLIFINRNDSDGARLFSLLHEAVHIWLGVASFYNERPDNTASINDVEQLCNAVTAEILVPNQTFKEKWNLYRQELPQKDVVEKLTVLFKCGITVIARRALDNNYINAVQYQEIVTIAINNYNKQRKMRKSGGGDFYRTAISRFDTRFLLALDNSIKERKTQYTDAYRLTGLNRTSFANLLDKVRGGT